MAELLLSDDEDTQVQEGEAAATLLESPAYLIAVERIRADCAEGILTSQPHQAEERERLYTLSRGLSAVTEELLAMNARGSSIIENATLSTLTHEDVQAEEPDDDVAY